MSNQELPQIPSQDGTDFQPVPAVGEGLDPESQALARLEEDALSTEELLEVREYLRVSGQASA